MNINNLKLSETKKWLKLVTLTSLLFAGSCTVEQNELNSDLLNGTTQSNLIGDSIKIDNPGFEDGKDDWYGVFAISSDDYSGSKSAKLSGSSKGIYQDISVDKNTNYTLSAYVLDGGTLGVSGSDLKEEVSGIYDDWTKVSVEFNSGSNTLVTIYGEYYDDEARFDDFILIKGDGGKIGNPGFEDDKDDWDGVFAISSDEYSGSKSAKLSGSSQGIYQDISVDKNTNYTLSAYVLDGGTLGVSGSDLKEEVSGIYDDWTKVSVEFNSGSNTLVTIYGDYYDDEARFDDFILIEGDGGSTGSNYTSVPAKIEAEDYSDASEGRTEITSDTGGGYDIGWIDEGEYLAYNINVPSAGIYTMDFRVASFDHKITFDIYAGSSLIGSVLTSTTGGWQTWKTTSTSVELPSGNITLKLVATGAYWNINWFEISSLGDQEEEEEEEEEETGNTGGNPEDILGSVIKDWKITYPVDKNGKDSSNADDCDDRNKDAHEQRDLTGSINSDYSDYFYVSGDEVVFKAHVGGATTSGSKYPRSEFRQLVGGDDNYWDMDDHQYLEVRVRATHLPKIKPEVSMVQIHGPKDEPLRVEYDAELLGLHVVQNEDNTKEDVMDYELGQQLFVTVTVDDGKIALYILNEDTGETYKDSWKAEDKTGYFKVGCYTQSNNNLKTCKPGEGWGNQNADEYGEVRIKDLKLVETY